MIVSKSYLLIGVILFIVAAHAGEQTYLCQGDQLK